MIASLRVMLSLSFVFKYIQMKNIYILIISFFIAFNLQAQPFSLDTTFNVNYNFYHPGSQALINNLFYEPDGKLMIYGYFQDGNTAGILRLYDNGSIDNSWFHNWDNEVTYMKRINNEYLVFRFGMFQSKHDYYGQNTDTAWWHNIDRDDVCGLLFYPHVFQDGSMFVGTDSLCLHPDSKTRYFKKFFANGKMDTNFNHSTNGHTMGVVKYSSDKLLLWANGSYGFTKYDTNQSIRMCRIDTAGIFDTTFHSIFTNFGRPKPVYIQNDGKIIVSGFFTIQNNSSYQNLIRLNADGSLDSTFNNFNSVVYIPSVPSGVSTICPTTDGGYLVGGYFKQYQGYARNNIAKIDINGFIDTTYFNGMAIDSVYGFPVVSAAYVNSIVKGTNDTYYVMGNFLYYNGKKVNPIIRIHGLTAGINEVEKENVKVYPNPATNSITFTGIYKDFKLTIFNAIGQIVLQKKLITSNTTLNIESFQRGMYYFQLINDKAKVISGKFVKN